MEQDPVRKIPFLFNPKLKISKKNSGQIPAMMKIILKYFLFFLKDKPATCEDRAANCCRTGESSDCDGKNSIFKVHCHLLPCGSSQFVIHNEIDAI